MYNVVMQKNLCLLLSIQERLADPAGQETTSPSKIVGMVEKQIIIRIGAKRRLLCCESEELRQDLIANIPCAGQATIKDDVIMKFEKDDM